MRALSLPMSFVAIAALAACSPKVDPKSPSFDEDLGGGKTQATAPDGATAVAAPPVRPDAPAGKGLRTGTIERAHLLAVLDAGPGAFLRQVEVTAHLDGERFVGWELLQLIDHGGPLADVDLAPGDVLLAVNGTQIARPDQLQTVWDGLRNANELTAELWRGKTKLELKFAVEPKI
jgi:hypothetical protein